MALSVSIERSRLTDRDKTVPSFLLSPSSLNDDYFPPPPSPFFCWYLKYWIFFGWVDWEREPRNGCLLSVFWVSLLGLLESPTGHSTHTHTHLTVCAPPLYLILMNLSRGKKCRTVHFQLHYFRCFLPGGQRDTDFFVIFFFSIGIWNESRIEKRVL